MSMSYILKIFEKKIKNFQKSIAFIIQVCYYIVTKDVLTLCKNAIVLPQDVAFLLLWII